MSGGPKIPSGPGGKRDFAGVGLQQPTTREAKTGPGATINDTARVDRAAALTNKNRTEPSHLARGLATIPGRVSSPTVVGNVRDLGGAIDEATLVTRVGMTDNAKIGPARVRPGTTAEARVAIRGGEVDYENTKILFRDANGKLTDLDGPFIWDAENVYIDSNGIIRADVPCFPDPNITKEVLGEDYDKVPKDPGEFMAALGKRANMPEIPLIPGTSTSVAGTSRTAPNGMPLAGNVHAGEREKNQLASAFNMSSLTFALEGLEPGTRAKLRPGPLRLGDGTILNLAEGAEIHIPENKLGQMKISLTAPIRSLQMEADGTVVRTGGGRIALDIDFSPPEGTVPAGSNPVQVHIRELDVAGLDLETPAGEGVHRVRVRDRIAVTSENGEAPVLSYASSANGSAINLRLPKVVLSGVTGEMEVQGTDGKTARLTLGDDGTGGPPRPLSVEASITVDSAEKNFVFDSHVADIAATLTPVALVDTQNFDLELAKSTLTGGGRVTVTSAGGKHELAMHADAGNPFTVAAAIADAKLGASKRATISELPESLRRTAERIQHLSSSDRDAATISMEEVRAAIAEPGFTPEEVRDIQQIEEEIEKAGTNLQLDLAAGTEGHLSLDTLIIGSDGTPVIVGHADPENAVASFNVELDELSLELPGGHNLNLAEGTSGKLVVNQLNWAANDKSPVVDAYVRIDLQPPPPRPGEERENQGANALIRPGKVPGLEGATVKIDAKTGQSYLEIKATIDKDGHVDCPIDVRIRDFEFKTQLESAGMAPLPEQAVPVAPLERRAPVKLETMTPLAAPPPSEPAPPASEVRKKEEQLGPLEMPEVSIPTAKLFGAIDDTVITVTIQPDELDSLVLPQGDDSFTFKRPKGPITATFTLVDGKVVPGKSKVTFDPPLQIASVIDWGPDVDLTIRGGVLKKDGDRATLDLDLDYDHAGVRAASIASLGWAGGKLESFVEGKVCELVTGRDSLPLDGEKLVEEVSEHLGLPTTINVGGKAEPEPPPAPRAEPKGPERGMVARKPGVDGSYPMGDRGSYDRLIEQMEARFHHWGRRGKGTNSAEAQADNEALARSFGRQLKAEIVATGGQEALAGLQHDRHLLEKITRLLHGANERDSGDNTIRDDNLAVVAREIAGELGAKSPEEHLADALNLDAATFAVANATFTADQIPLGGEQGIEILPGSNLTITGTPDDYTITGDARFGNINIGNADLAAKLASGEGHLTVRVKRGADGTPRVTIDVKDLNTTNMEITGRVGTGTSTLKNATVKAGSIHVALGGGEPDAFRVVLNGVKGDLSGGGAASHKGGRGAVEKIEGEIEGDITWENGQITGVLDHIDMKVDGLSFNPGGTGDTRGDVHVRGAATFLTDADGRIVIGKNGDKSFLTDATVTTPDGSTFTIENGEADELVIETGLPPNVTARNLRGVMSCVTPLARDADGKPTSVLNIRRADLAGTVHFGRAGLSTDGKIAMSNVDASVANLTINPTGQSLLDLEQIDFSGRGFLERNTAGAWVLTGERVEDRETGEVSSTLTTQAVARDIKFATDSPEITLDLADKAQAEIELFALTVGGGQPASIHLGRGKFFGVVETGDVTVGDEKSVLNKINFKPGALVEIDVNHLLTGAYSAGDKMATDITMRVEGDFGDQTSPAEEYGVKLERMSFAGDFRMILRALTDGKGNFSARSHTIVNADASVHVTADVDPAAAYEQGKQAMRERAEAQRRAEAAEED